MATPLKAIIKTLVDNLEFYPAVWDCANEGYANQISKKAQLEELAVLCKTNYKDVEKKYSSLRTKFRKVSD